MTTTLEVQGMTCGACVRHVTDALRVPGVGNVDVRLRDGLVVVEHDATTAPTATLVAALDQAGYGARTQRRCCCG